MPSGERYNTHNPVLIWNIFYNVHGLIISIKSESMQYAMRETDLMFLFHNQFAQVILKIFQKIFSPTSISYSAHHHYSLRHNVYGN